jgi:hypothetical protein
MPAIGDKLRISQPPWAVYTAGSVPWLCRWSLNGLLTLYSNHGNGAGRVHQPGVRTSLRANARHSALRPQHSHRV